MERSRAGESDPRWRAVLAQEREADGSFVYAVISTGIYCRPSCGARRPRRENVRFFPNAEAARKAGFRPCRRCHPDIPAQASRAEIAVAEALRQIEESPELPDFAAIAAAIGFSRHHFHRLFRRETGLTPGEYYRNLKKRRIVDALEKGKDVTSAIHEAGYGSTSRFYENGGLGLAPSAWKKGGEGARIRFAIAESWLGPVLVAATDKGLCALTFGDDPELLLRGLQDRFPRAELIGGDERFEAFVAQVIGMVEAPYREITIPLDVRGSAFQVKVWDALSRIPPGETASYAEIAARIGYPRAVRAVARACGANPVAIAIPCHRVVRRDGCLSGYRWGVERKAALIAREREAISKGSAAS